jgi:hypothetical protein
MSTPFAVGTIVSYTRKNGTVVTAPIAIVGLRSNPEQAYWFTNEQLVNEDIAYRLKLSEVHYQEIGHNVTVGHSRCRLAHGDK